MTLHHAIRHAVVLFAVKLDIVALSAVSSRWVLRAQAFIGRGLRTESESLLREVLVLDRNDADASDLLRQLGQMNREGTVR